MRLGLCLLLCMLAGCAGLPPSPGGQRVVLLGEVHDNAEGHARRTEWLAAALADGWRPALALEQFDREQQPSLEAARRRCGRDAACVIAAVGEPAGWTWSYYEPVIALALRYRLPLLAANLSREQARTMIHGQQPYPAPVLAVDAGWRQQMAAVIAKAHCDLLPAELTRRMALAQLARDLAMAEVIRAAAPRDVVLLAGNGHVRRDIGVPRWLSTPVEVVGFVEQAEPAARFDQQVRVPPASRQDPCAS